MDQEGRGVTSLAQSAAGLNSAIRKYGVFFHGSHVAKQRDRLVIHSLGICASMMHSIM
jgi:hypothetical protein